MKLRKNKQQKMTGLSVKIMKTRRIKIIKTEEELK
jgi:hypothetical protein